MAVDIFFDIDSIQGEAQDSFGQTHALLGESVAKGGGKLARKVRREGEPGHIDPRAATTTVA